MKYYTTGLVILIVILTTVGCSTTPTGNIVSENNPQTIKIGAILLMSGDGATWGQNSKHGIDLALKDIEANPLYDNYKFEIYYEDNPSNTPRTAVDAYHKLRSIGIDKFIGPSWVTSSLAVAPLACQDGVLMISPTAGSSDFHQSCDNIFDLWANDDILSFALADYLLKQGTTNIAVIGSQDSWEKRQAENVKIRFEKIGGTVSEFHLAQVDEKDFHTLALKVKNSDAQAVVFTNMAHEALTTKQFREFGIALPYYSVVVDNDMIQAAKGAMENTIVVNSYTPTEEFKQRFTATYNKQPDAGSDSGYDAMMLIAQAILETNQLEGDNLAQHLKTIVNYDGMSGDLQFNEHGNVVKEPTFLQVKNNVMIPFEVS